MLTPLQKIKATILFFCENTDPKFLGKVKLMKLFYFLDFVHTKKYGAPVTYDRYVKLEHGPIPSVIKNLVDEAGDDIEHSVLADVIDIERPEGIDMYRVVPRRSLTKEDKSLFSESELEVMTQTCKRFANKNTDFIEEASHKEAPWRKTSMFEDIPYTLATEDSDSQVTKEQMEVALKIAEQ